MQTLQQTIGNAAELRALEYLTKRGCTLREKNFRCRMGEIDLIMHDKMHIIFVEVRYRKNNEFGGSIASVTESKKYKLIRTAKFYLQKHNLLEKTYARFDVIAIDGDHVDWIQNAFLASSR